MDIRLPKESLRALRSLLDTGTERIVALSSSLDSSGPSLASPHSRAVVLSESLGDTSLVNQLDQIFTDFIYPAHDIRYRLDLSPEEFLALLDGSIVDAKPEHWPADYAEKWSRAREPLLLILGSQRLSQEA